MAKYLFVDHENINLKSIGSLTATDLEVWVFVGPNQKNLPMETVRSLLSFPTKPRIVQITRQGKNSLDFHISFELGALSRDEPKPEKVYVLSNDKGYDSVVEYAHTKGLAVERITSLTQVPSRGPSQKARAGAAGLGTDSGTDVRALIVASLQKIQGNQRPRKLATLRAWAANQFKKHGAQSTSAAIDRLLASGRLVEEKGKLRYNL